MGPPMWGLCPLLIVSFACFIFLMPAKKYLIYVSKWMFCLCLRLCTKTSVSKEARRSWSLNPAPLQERAAGDLNYRAFSPAPCPHAFSQ